MRELNEEDEVLMRKEKEKRVLESECREHCFGQFGCVAEI